MVYYYSVKVKYMCGGQGVIKEYIKSFLEIGELFTFLENKHKDNYILISIKPCYKFHLR